MSERKMCEICLKAGKRRASFPLDKKFKSNYEAHMKLHGKEKQVQQEKDKSVQVSADLHKRISHLRKIANKKMKLDDSLYVSMSAVIAIGISKIERDWGVEDASHQDKDNESME